MARRVSSHSLLKWIYWMALDLLESKKIDIQYRFVYYDRKRKMIIVRKTPIQMKIARYYRMDGCADARCRLIFIDPIAKDRALCLFHECLEFLFTEWKESFFQPKHWGIHPRSDQDPIRYLEAATWEKLTKEQKNTIKSFLPKGP